MLTVFILCIGMQTVHAQETEDMSKWSFKILLQHSDQLDELKIVRFKNRETGRYGFCLQPEVDYAPVDFLYVKEKCENEEIYKIYKAFEMLGEDYYIAAQLMIWEKLCGIRYSFDGKDAAEFGERELLNAIESLSEEVTIEEMTVYANRGEEASAYIDGLEEYNVISSDVTITKRKGDDLCFVFDSDKKDCHIVLKSDDLNTDGSYVYYSKESQDIYSFEGKSNSRREIDLHIEEEPHDEQFFSFSFSKKDGKGKPISGALFQVFEIDEKGEDILFIQKGERIDLAALFGEIKSIDVSERYEKYINGLSFLSEEIGLFPYTIETTERIHKGLAFVCDDPNLTKGKALMVQCNKERELYSSESETNTIDHLDKGKQYILCETKPKKGYIFASNPCLLMSSEDTINEPAEFINVKRRFDLKLYKVNEDRNILLNGARFKVSYEDSGKRKELFFMTGALNIQRDEEGAYVVYRHENEEIIRVGKFEDDFYIRKDAVPGKYYYCITNDPNINSSSLLKRETEVTEGSFQITDMPYFSDIEVTELEAPKGYFIEEASFRIEPDIDYSEIVFRNFRMNRAEIIPEKKHSIPKTCVGN